MKKIAAIIFGTMLMTTQVYGNTTAGFVDQTNYDTGYRNPTQFIFENYDVWNPEPENSSVEIFVETIPTVPYSVSELYLVKQVVTREYGGKYTNQPIQGYRAVIDVILNRVDSPEFPNTIYGVLTQPGQFEDPSLTVPIEQLNLEAPDFLDQLIAEEVTNRSYPALLYFCSDGYIGTPAFEIGGMCFGY